MKIIVEETTTTTKEIDVKFPLYIQGDLSEDDYELIYVLRIHEDGTYYEITKSQSLVDNSQPEYSIETGKFSLRNDLGQYLDPTNTRYQQINIDIFNARLEEVQIYLSRFILNRT